MARFSPEYLAYMQSPQWRQFRERVLARDGYRCVTCRGRRSLEVDHLTYVRLGHERLSDCQTLCHPCHVRKTRVARRRRGGRRRAPMASVWTLGLLILMGLLVLGVVVVVGRSGYRPWPGWWLDP
jgi:HNH endonuclease